MTRLVHHRSGLTLLFLALGILSVFAIVAALAGYPASKAENVRLEIVKSALQMLSVIVLGQVIASTVKEREYFRQRTEARDAILVDWLKRLIGIYTQVKKHRRLVRARGINPPYRGEAIDPLAEVAKRAYGRHMVALNDIEIELEGLWHEVSAVRHNVLGNDTELVSSLESMKDYLRGLLRQFEEQWNLFPATEVMELSTLDQNYRSKGRCLGDFLGPTSLSRDQHSEFHQQFIKRFRVAAFIIRKRMLSADEPDAPVGETPRAAPVEKAGAKPAGDAPDKVQDSPGG
jgi:hypothetical protein